tara:strand:+ start:153 stop:419 length:267 start_codon:yes stop_codon:yes gene_type:complete
MPKFQHHLKVHLLPGRRTPRIIEICYGVWEFGEFRSLKTPGAQRATWAVDNLCIMRINGVWEFRSLRQEPNNSVYLCLFDLSVYDIIG